MKRISVLISILSFPLCLNAQDMIKSSDVAMSLSFVAGVQADVHIAVTYAYTGENSLNLLAGGGILFARKYIGEHLAIEIDICKAVSEKTFVESFSPDPYPTHTYSYRMSSLDIPMNLQYHMGKRGSDLRPYVGLGIGYASMTSYGGYTNWPEIDGRNTVTTGVMMQATEGITYRLNNKLLLEQSMYYQVAQDIGNHRVGLRLGLGYIIR
ncbi:MAG: outer membrane beta-barrel protein [Chitinophagaceae bacterium]|nr:outer membrane beta-barrel protein [Chitinophagaceae bacterium]MCB9045950.1 outer membrane beta-barrel protein [Chitinophagales bacterium]